MAESALEIETGWELQRFDLGTVMISGTRYTVLTGFEDTGLCFWCGGVLKGKLKRYCRGHMTEYYRHFEWASARRWCIERQDGRCANCGIKQGSVIGINHNGWKMLQGALEVHHIIPLCGEKRYFSAFNLPWNLIGFCHDCHQEVHAVMREASKPDPFALAIARGQGVFAEFLDRPHQLTMLYED